MKTDDNRAAQAKRRRRLLAVGVLLALTLASIPLALHLRSRAVQDALVRGRAFAAAETDKMAADIGQCFEEGFHVAEGAAVLLARMGDESFAAPTAMDEWVRDFLAMVSALRTVDLTVDDAVRGVHLTRTYGGTGGESDRQIAARIASAPWYEASTTAVRSVVMPDFSAASLWFGAPVVRDGRVIGAVGVQLSLESVRETVAHELYRKRSETLLIAPEGWIAADRYGRFEGEPVERADIGAMAPNVAQALIAVTAGDRAFSFDTRDGEELVMGRVIYPGTTAEPWTLISVYPAWAFTRGVGDRYLWIPAAPAVVMALFAMAFFVCGRWEAGLGPDAVDATPNTPRPSIDRGASGKRTRLSFREAERLRMLNRRRWRYHLLGALFCIPVLFFMADEEKRFREAEKAGNLIEASRAVEAMRMPAYIGVAIGLVAIALRLWVGD